MGVLGFLLLPLFVENLALDASCAQSPLEANEADLKGNSSAEFPRAMTSHLLESCSSSIDGDPCWAGVGGWVAGALAGVVMMVNAGLLMLVTATIEGMSRVVEQDVLDFGGGQELVYEFRVICGSCLDIS